MAKERRRYAITVGGMTYTYNLTREQAERRGFTDANLQEEKAAPKPANKARTAANKAEK